MVILVLSVLPLAIRNDRHFSGFISCLHFLLSVVNYVKYILKTFSWEAKILVVFCEYIIPL